MKKTSIQKVSINEAKRFFSLYFNLPIEEFNAKKQPGGGYISTHTAVLDNKYGTILTYSKINNIVHYVMFSPDGFVTDNFVTV